jgi:signal transduction histidine kinase
MYRTAQEALTNVAKHSTARTARVVVRVRTRSGSPFAEVEVTDDGRARAGSTGSGLGHMGIRERAGLLGGTVEVGPRATGGYRVRLRVPLEGGDA